MRKIHIIGLALVAAFAFSAVAVASASAHEWLTLAGVKVEKAEKSTADGLWLVHLKKIGALEGGGELAIHCEGSFDGTVGPGAADKVEKVLGTKGELGTKESPIKCEVTESTNSICKAKTAVNVETVHLGWATELLLIGSVLYDHFFEEGTKGEPGYETTCNGIGVSCEGLERAEFLANLATGAEFTFLGELKAEKCTFGEGFVLGHLVVLGFLAM